MKINFKSTISQNESQNVIQFDSPVLIKQGHQGKKIFEFTEPENDVNNIIELSEQEIKIKTSNTLVWLKKDKETDFFLTISDENGQNHTFDVYSHWYKSDFSKPNYYLFEYILGQKSATEKVVFGTYKIELTISE